MTTVNDQSAGRILDVDEARIAALREHAHRYPYEVVGLPAPYHKMTGAEVTAGFAAYDALPTADDMTGPVVSVEHVGLPSPDHHAIAAHTATLNTRLEIGRVLTRYRANDVDGAEAIDEILTAVAVEPDGPTYTAPLTIPAGDLEVPRTWPRWQVLDASDEETWHDLTGVADCDDPGCEVTAGSGDPDVACVVLTSGAWSGGFAHFRDNEYVDVRIPGGDPVNARDEILRDIVTLADELGADSRIPVDRYTFRVSYCIGGDDDEAGMAELQRIADVLGAEITNSSGTHFYVRMPFGQVEYEAYYILREEMADYQAFMATRPKRKAKDSTPPGTGDAPVADMAVEAAGAPDFELGPDEEDEPEHYHVGGAAGGQGDNEAECACGVTYAGFNSHAEAVAMLDAHILEAGRDKDPAVEPDADGDLIAADGEA